jgi:ribosome biogenesis protein BMS1
MLQQMQTLRKEKDRKRKLQKSVRREKVEQVQAKDEAKRLERMKRERKAYFREESKTEKRNAKRGASNDGSSFITSKKARSSANND